MRPSLRRDRFAPAAGWLAKGIVMSSLGRTITDFRTIEIAEPAIANDAIRGEIMRVDRFGNLISNIDQRALDRLAQQGAIVVSVNGREVSRLVATYAEAGSGELCALFGSTNHLEVAVNGGSAAETLGLTRGAPLTVTVRG